MGHIYRPITYKPLPKGAELFERRGKSFARWKDTRGRTQSAPIVIPGRGKHAGTRRIAVESGRYMAVWRDADGKHSVATGCRDEIAARGVLAKLERRSELVKGNVLSHSEALTADHQTTSLSDHFAAYDEHLRVHINRKTGFTASIEHRRNRLDQLRRIARDLEWKSLREISRTSLERWLVAREAEEMGPRTRNTYAISWTAFGNWCVDTHRLMVNPFHRLGKANERADCRRQRRALSAVELQQLIDAARLRPLAELGRPTSKLDRTEATANKRSHWELTPLSPGNLKECEAAARERLSDDGARIAELENSGLVRALTYKMLVLTGLRLNELRTLTIGQADLNGAEPRVVIRAAYEKARRGAEIPLRRDLAADLALYLNDRLRREQRAAMKECRPVPMAMAADSRLIEMPTDLIRVLDRDLIAAGLASRVSREDGSGWVIDKADDRGRTLDLHAFRTTFNSLLAAAGVSETTRRLLMRHAAKGVTDNHYADPKLIDLRGALDQLPMLPLEDRLHRNTLRAVAGSNCGVAPSSKVPRIKSAPVYGGVYTTDGKTCHFERIGGKTEGTGISRRSDVSDALDKRSVRMATVVKKRATRLERATSSLEGWCSTIELHPRKNVPIVAVFFDRLNAMPTPRRLARTQTPCHSRT